jgi:hypothetical protein
MHTLATSKTIKTGRRARLFSRKLFFKSRHEVFANITLFCARSPGTGMHTRYNSLLSSHHHAYHSNEHCWSLFGRHPVPAAALQRCWALSALKLEISNKDNLKPVCNLHGSCFSCFIDNVLSSLYCGQLCCWSFAGIALLLTRPSSQSSHRSREETHAPHDTEMTKKLYNPDTSEGGTRSITTLITDPRPWSGGHEGPRPEQAPLWSRYSTGGVCTPAWEWSSEIVANLDIQMTREQRRMVLWRL